MKLASTFRGGKGTRHSFVLVLLVGLGIISNWDVNAGSRDDYYRAKALRGERQYDAALDVLEGALDHALEREDFYYAFYFARDMATCHERLGNVRSYLARANEALGYLDVIEERDIARMTRRDRMTERKYLEGVISKHYFFSHHLALARMWHDRANETLVRVLEQDGVRGYDLLSGEVPRGIQSDMAAQVPRQLWFDAWILQKEARTEEALARLEAAERFIQYRRKPLSDDEEAYRLKVRNEKAQLLDFIGWKEEAIEIQREDSRLPLTPVHRTSILIQRMNLIRNLSQHFGPSEAYLRDAIAAYNQLRVFASRTTALYARKMIAKMISDLRDVSDADWDLEEVEEMFAETGLDLAADYTERDQIEIAIDRGETEGLEDRLIELIEKFRDQGNLTGSVTLYREYGDLCLKLDRPEDAIFLYQRTLALTEEYGWFIHVPRLMVKLAQAHWKRGDVEAAEARMRQMETYLAEHPQIPAYRIAEARVELAEFLLLLGRKSEAARLRDEILAYAEANDVPEYQIDGLFELDFAGDDTIIEQEVVEEPVRTDFEPKAVASEVASGEQAHARFTLANYSPEGVEGSLVFSGGVEVLSWDSVSGVLRLVHRSDQIGRDGGRQELDVGAGEILRVYIEGEPGVDEGGSEVEFVWQPAASEAQSSSWVYSATEEGNELTVVNANLIELNPFYFVPLYHLVRLRDEADRVRDFRVTCSVPCYVEMVDDESHAVIAIDRLGDGSFEEQGDMVAQDENGNLYPDHRFADREDTYGFELRVYPTEVSNYGEVEEIRVLVEGIVRGEWEVLAENRIGVSEMTKRVGEQ
ncbi:MAG: hypothetical protein AAF591_01295 [Verrucomicrobiota bacterium]